MTQCFFYRTAHKNGIADDDDARQQQAQRGDDMVQMMQDESTIIIIIIAVVLKAEVVVVVDRLERECLAGEGAAAGVPMSSSSYLPRCDDDAALLLCGVVDDDHTATFTPAIEIEVIISTICDWGRKLLGGCC